VSLFEIAERNVMYYLYKKTYTEKQETDSSEFLNSCSIEVLNPNPIRYRLHCEKIGFKQYLSRVYFWLITGGKYKIYFLRHDDDIAHSSYVVPKCGKFSFMKKGDYEIGPCVTSTDYRRKGCYHYVLNHITSQKEYRQSEFYMIVKSTNEPSIKGIEKSGFIRCGIVKKTYLLKKYVKEKDND